MTARPVDGSALGGLAASPRVKSASRVLDVLELIATKPGGASFTALGDELGLPKSSLHYLLSTLSERGWVHLDEPSRVYRLGLRVWQLAHNFDWLETLARLALEDLASARDELNETVQLAVLDGVENVYVAKVEADHPLQLVSRVGSRLPAYATGLGKVLLSGLAEDELRRRMNGTEFARYTNRTITSIGALERQLAEIRSKGYGEDEEEYTPGVYCVAVPVFGQDGAVVAAISCSVPSARVGRRTEQRDRLVDVLTQRAKAISGRLTSPASA